DVDHAFLGLHLGVQLVQVGQARDIALGRADVPADLGLGLVEFGLTAAGDEDIGTLVDETLGRGQADAARSARDDGHFSFKIRHDILRGAAIASTAFGYYMPPPLGSVSREIGIEFIPDWNAVRCGRQSVSASIMPVASSITRDWRTGQRQLPEDRPIKSIQQVGGSLEREPYLPIEQQRIVLLVLCCHLSAHRVVTLSLTSTLPLIALEYGQMAWAALTMSSALALPRPVIAMSSVTARLKPPWPLGSRPTSLTTSMSLSRTLSACARVTWMTAFSKQAA